MRRLVLIGGGHAHLEVLRQAAARPLGGAELLLVSPHARHHYSSMVPGYLQGTYAEAELTFDLAALCAAAGARFREARAERVDPGGRWVDVEGERVECDLVSADVGSVAMGFAEVPGVSVHAHTVRPMARVAALRRHVDALVVGTPNAGSGRAPAVPSVCVVGGGAGGVEVALAVWRRFAAAHRPARVTLVERAPALLGDYAPGVRQAIGRILRARDIRSVTGRAVTRVTADAVLLDAGDPIPSALTIWMTGAAPAAVTSASDLPADEHGFWLVDPTLRSVGGGAVWGAGDCVTLRDHPHTPRAGVYAVRAAPVLAANLRAALQEGPTAAMRRYVPQRHFLAILNTADGRALLRWRGLTAHARWAWWLKDAIDRRFVGRYRAASAALPAGAGTIRPGGD